MKAKDSDDAEKKRAAASAAPAGGSRSMHYKLVIAKDGSRRYEYLSEGVRWLYGVSPEEGIADASLIVAQRHPEDVARLDGIVKNALQERIPFEAEIRLRGPEGRVLWSALCSIPVVRPDGSVLCEGMEVDITRFKERERALQETEHLFRESQQAASIGSYRTDFIAGTWVGSEMLDQIFGVGPDYRRDVAGWLGLVHPEDREGMDRYLAEEVLGKRTSFHREYRIVRKRDGQTRWVLGMGELTVLPDGRVASMVGIIRDITARKERERERERLLVGLEHTGEAVMITDPQGNIEYVNAAFERSTGYGRAEVLGENPRLLKSGQQGEDFYRELWATIAAGHTWRGRLMNKRKDGGLFTEEATISPVFDQQRRIVNFVAVKHDITERLRLELDFLQSQKMETVGRLAGGVAHDFNNMLGVIFGLTEMALMELDESQPAHAHLVGIRDAARRSAELTKRLMAFARRQTIAPKVLDLNTTVEGMLAMLRRLLGEDIHLLWRPGAGLGAIKADPTQVDQVLANLCVNARDAINSTGEVVLETALVRLGPDDCAGHEAAAPGSYVMLSVQDDGRGMDGPTLSRAFEPFFTTKGQGKGTGLGLAMVYGIVRQNRGVIQVLSAPGEGSTFKIFWPCHDGLAAVSAAPGVEPPIDCRATVLLVEDEPALLRLSAGMLRRMGCAVLEAASPAQALALAEARAAAPDLLLTDVIMPGMNGAELAALLQAKWPGLKVLYMSGYTANIIARHGVVAEGINFLPKPFEFSDLAARVLASLKAGS